MSQEGRSVAGLGKFNNTHLSSDNVGASIVLGAPFVSGGIDNIVGTLTPGKKADIIMFNTKKINFVPIHDPVSSILFHSNPSDIDTVIINGNIVKRNGDLLVRDLNNHLSLLANSGARIMNEYRGN